MGTEEVDPAEMPGSDLASIELPFRFKVVNAVPVASFVTLVGGLALAGAPGQAPHVATLLANARQYGWAGAAVITALIVLLSFIAEPLEISSIRLLEGYWAPSGAFRSLINAGVWLQRRKRSRLQFLSGQSGVPHDVAQWAASALYEHYPREDRLLPTTLGNRLRAFEDRAGVAYNISSTIWWPRLHLALSGASFIGCDYASVLSCPRELVGVHLIMSADLSASAFSCCVVCVENDRGGGGGGAAGRSGHGGRVS